MLGKFVESLYLKIFVNIVVTKTESFVYIETANNKGVVDSIEDTFKTTTLNEQMYKFIESFTKETPYYYISILDTSLTQGVISDCIDKKIQHGIDMSTLKYMCYNNKWRYYTSKSDISSIQKVYSKIGIDYIFSPFILLNYFFKDKIDTHLAMFILVEDNALSLSIFDNSELLYGCYLDMEHDTVTEELIIDNIEEDIDLDSEIDLDDVGAIDDMESLEDFGDIEDLDTLDDIDEFSDARDFEEELAEEAEETEKGMPINDADGFTDDYHRFSMIQSAVNKFYKDDSLNSQFIETVYVADGVGVSGDFKTYLEEEMFLSVYIRHIDLATQVCELAKMETL